MMNATQLRSTFTDFFAERGHIIVPSASLVPHDPTVLFTIAGMVPFKPYFLGEDPAPWPRATSVQKCFRTVDIDVIGLDQRHCTFFEMLGNFSFGDYFKETAIPLAWELLTEVLGVDGDRLWVTVFETDDEARDLWLGDPRRPRGAGAAHGVRGQLLADGRHRTVRAVLGAVLRPGARVRRRRRARLRRGRALRRDLHAGVHAVRPGHRRHPRRPAVQEHRHRRRARAKPPRAPGGGVAVRDRPLPPILAVAEDITETRYGADVHSDVSLRILADHARAMAMVVADGVLPSNEGRGYVLRRIIRRAVRRAFQLGVHEQFTPRLVASVAEVLGGTYPVLVDDLDRIQETVEREEGAFRRTLDAGSVILEEALQDGSGRVSGESAFKLHDTHGFPIELTMEMAAEAGVEVDTEGFEREMAAQRELARADARRRRQAMGDDSVYRELLAESGPTRFTGYEHYEEPTSVVAVLGGAEPGAAEIVLDRTPFYAEGGGQVGDTGVITTETGRARVLDTQYVLPGLIVHRVTLEGEMYPSQDALAVIDGRRRDATRRHHTGTHLLHSALRQVLGDHVRQQGSFVRPDRLHFDFSHPKAPRPEELAEVVDAANADILTDAAVEVIETSKEEAEALGALAFFKDKYGDRVRVVRAGAHSTEFCGGTHVDALGMIGPITVVSEGSIGSNTRRIEAVTGSTSLALLDERRRILDEAAHLLKVEPNGVVDALQKVLDRQREANKELQRMRGARVQEDAARLAQQSVVGVVVHREDGLVPELLRDLAQAIVRHGARVAVVAGSPDGSKVGVAVASGVDDVDAGVTAKELAVLVGGGGGGSAELAVAGGSDPSKIDALLAEARRRLGA